MNEVQKLVSDVLQWWEEHKFDVKSNNHNAYDDVPDFVLSAQLLATSDNPVISGKMDGSVVISKDTIEFNSEVPEDNILQFNGETRHDVSVERVLRGAIVEDLKDVVICGVGNDGFPFLATSSSSISRVNLHLDLAKRFMLKLAENK